MRKGHIHGILDTITPAPVRESWGYQHVTAPRKPCPTVGVELREMLPGETRCISGVRVHRGDGSKSKWYIVGGRRMLYADALAALAKGAAA